MRRLARGLVGTVALLATLAAALQAQSADPSALAAGWVRESWSIADGLPVNSINGLIQSRTGYIWAATFDGLVRFDGVRFTVYNSANSPGLPSNRIISVMEARDSALWLLTEQRYLVRFARGRFTHINESRGLVVSSPTSQTVGVRLPGAKEAPCGSPALPKARLSRS